MVTLRLRYQDGHLIPLEPLPSLREGEEIEVQWQPFVRDEDIDAMLDRTCGIWADFKENNDV